MTNLLHATSIRIDDEEMRMLKELINSYADFTFKRPSKNDIIREAIRELYKKEILSNQIEGSKFR